MGEILEMTEIKTNVTESPKKPFWFMEEPTGRCASFTMAARNGVGDIHALITSTLSFKGLDGRFVKWNQGDTFCHAENLEEMSPVIGAREKDISCPGCIAEWKALTEGKK